MRGLRIGRLFGIDIKLDLSWVLFCGFFAMMFITDILPLRFPGFGFSTYLIGGVLIALGILPSIIFHEIAHSLVARFFRIRVREIVLFIFGGVAKLEGEITSSRAEFLVSIAGPISSIFLQECA